jgi:RsmE family RNA methyltransferase
MNLILLHQKDFIDSNLVRLHGRRFEHACKILKVTIGKRLQVGLIGGKAGSGTVTSIDATALEVKITLDKSPPAPIPITLILAMPRPKVFKRVLQGLTAFGVKEIILLNSWRVDKSYWQSPCLKPEALREQLILGLEQARDTILPNIQLQQRFKPFVEDDLPELAVDSCALVAHPGSSQSCPANLQEKITLAIGPEGGFTPYEVDLLVNAGLKQVHLGARPLRVETAVPALIGRLLPSNF